MILSNKSKTQLVNMTYKILLDWLENMRSHINTEVYLRRAFGSDSDWVFFTAKRHLQLQRN